MTLLIFSKIAWNFHYVFPYYKKGSCWNIIPILIVCALGVAWQVACSLWFLARMLTHNWFVSCGKGRIVSNEWLLDVPKKKKDLGTHGSHSPAVRHLTAHGSPTNRMLQNLGWDSTLQMDPLLVQEVARGMCVSCCKWSPQSLNLMDSIPLMPLRNMCWNGISKINA